MTESFSGFISIDDDDETSPIVYTTHKSIEQQINMEDMRISIVREYLLHSPNSSLKDIRTKALAGCSEPSSEELKTIIQSANIEKYNELYSQVNADIISTNTSTISAKSKFSTEEVEFLEQHRHGYNRAEIYEKYKSAFPGSGRKLQFLYDYYYSHPDKSEIRHVQERIPEQVRHTTQNQHILTKTIRFLYKSGITPDRLPTIKPVINELLAHNSSQEEIEFAIEYMKL